jgi:hypothetical protein
MSAQQSRTITFFYSDLCERHAVDALAAECSERGLTVEFTVDLKRRADIGVYCQHNVRPNANHSIIMLHDMAQRHDIWPHFWVHEPWNEFDIGILPGKTWVERWRTLANYRVAQPRIGVFEFGWPKADPLFKNASHFEARSVALRAALGLKFPVSILYAPSWENDGKQNDFVSALYQLPVNLLLKQAPWSQAYPKILSNIDEMNSLHKGFADNVYILDPKTNIIDCLGVSDLLVSDESSVLLEASLFRVPSLAVSDWLIPDRSPPRPACVPYKNIRTTTKASLRDDCLSILENYQEAAEEAISIRDENFSNLGFSSARIVDLIFKHFL